MDRLDLLAVQGTLKSLLQHHSSKASILQCSAFFIVQLSYPYMTTRKTIALMRWTFVDKVMSLLFNMLSRLVIAFLPRSKHLLISWLQSPSAVILEPKKPNKNKNKFKKKNINAFLSDQYKEIEENNSMGKTRDLPKKIRDTKGKFHAKMGKIKDRNGMDLTKIEDIKKRWQEYTEELYKKNLQDQDSYDGLITHLEPQILECEVK